MKQTSKAMMQVRIFQIIFLVAAAVGLVLIAAVDGGAAVGAFLLVAGLLGFFVLVGVVGYVKAGAKS